MGALEGRVALVTGGGRGIGRGISLGLAADGAIVAVNYRRDEDAANETVAAIQAAGGTAKKYFAGVDVLEEDETMVAQIVQDFGGIDILVNNAGIASRGNSVADTEPGEMERVVRIHAFGPFYLSKLVLPSMRTRPRGDIIMVSSAATAHYGANGSPYNMGKAALEALAFTLYKEERRNNIHVNIVAPGLVESDMGVRLARAMRLNKELSLRDLDAESPFGHVCQPSDVADVIRYLCSDAAGYLTGQRIQVDGGGNLFGY